MSDFNVFEDDTITFVQKFKNNDTEQEVVLEFVFKPVNEKVVMKLLSSKGIDEIKDAIDPNITDPEEQAKQVAKMFESGENMDAVIASQDKIYELMGKQLISAPQFVPESDGLTYIMKLKMSIRMKLLEDFSNEFIDLEQDTIGKKWERA